MPKQDLNYNKFQWHFGVVEDRNDPFNLGRVKVRFYGVHSDKLDDVSTDQLPWATVIQSPTSPATSGVGGPIVGELGVGCGWGLGGEGCARYECWGRRRRRACHKGIRACP